MTAARVGILGGTFDPVHIGHLVVADDAAAALGLDEVWFVPAGQHPLKGARVEAAAADRWAMVCAAIEGNPRFRALDAEIARPGPSYSVDTVRMLRERHPDVAFFFLIGTDVAAELHKWKEPETLARLATLTVLSRGGERPRVEGSGCPVPCVTVEVTRVDISSTEIRRRVREGRPYRYLVPEAAYRIIRERGLYRPTRDLPAAAETRTPARGAG